MKKLIHIAGIIVTLMVSLIIFTGCTTKEENEVVEKKTYDYSSEVINTSENSTEYKYNKLYFSLPNTYEETESDSREAVIYSQEVIDDVKKRFSVGIFNADDKDFMKDALEALKTYEFKLLGYKAFSRKDPVEVEYNGIKVISVDVKYDSPNIDGDAEIEYCFVQNGDTVYVIYFEMFAQNGKRVENFNFAEAFNDIKSSLKFED